MGPARIYPWRKMHRPRAPSIAPGTYFVAQPWADCITNMLAFNLRQAQRTETSDRAKQIQTISIVEVRSLRRSPAKHIDLLPQDQVFRFQRCSRIEARSQDTADQLEQIGH